MTGTTFINAINWPYLANNQEVVVLPDAEAVLRANGWVHRTDPLRDQLAHTPAFSQCLSDGDRCCNRCGLRRRYPTSDPDQLKRRESTDGPDDV